MARLTQDQVVTGLVARGVPQHVAQGVAMNFRDESGFNTGIQELNPHNGRGGYGLAQWTGPRRNNLEQYAANVGRPADDPDTQLDFFMYENAGPEKAAWQKVMAAKDAPGAAVQFVNEWERPAAQHAAARSARYGGGEGIAVNDPRTDRTTPWHGPPEVSGGDDYRQQLAAAIAGHDQPKSWINEMGDALSSMKFGSPQFTGASQVRAPPQPVAARAEAVAPVAALGGDRRQLLAEALAKLNSGRLTL